MTWTSESSGRIRSLDADAVVSVLVKEKFEECCHTSAALLYVKQTAKAGFMVFSAAQKDGSKFFEFQVDVMRSLPEKVVNQCKEWSMSSSSWSPFSSAGRPRSSSGGVLPRSSSDPVIVRPSSSSIRDTVIITRSSSSIMDTAIIVAPISSGRIDSLFIRSSNSRLDSMIVHPVSSGRIVWP